MRLAVPLLVALLFLGWVACTFPEPSGHFDEPLGGNPWRRTVDGWERNDRWQPDFHVEPPVPHPAIVAVWQVLAAGLIGVAALPEQR